MKENLMSFCSGGTAKRVAVVGACALFLQACAVPVPLKIASWALDGISYLATHKSLTDHGLSVVAQRDCALLRSLQGEEICRQDEDGTDGSVLAAVESAPSEPAPTVETASADTPASEAAPTKVGAWTAPTDDEPAKEEAIVPSEFVTAAGDNEPEETKAVSTQPWGDIYYVVASFRKIERADVILKRYPDLDLRVLSGTLDGRNVFRVAAGPFESGNGAAVRRMIRKAGLSNVWAVRMPLSRWTVARKPGVGPQLASVDKTLETVVID